MKHRMIYWLAGMVLGIAAIVFSRMAQDGNNPEMNVIRAGTAAGLCIVVAVIATVWFIRSRRNS